MLNSHDFQPRILENDLQMDQIMGIEYLHLIKSHQPPSLCRTRAGISAAPPGQPGIIEANHG